jgi:hypothetical protein
MKCVFIFARRSCPRYDGRQEDRNRDGVRQALIRFSRMSGSWGCPHEVDGLCQRVNGAICEPGMRGCAIDGKVTFPDGRPHLPRWPSPRDARERASSDSSE